MQSREDETKKLHSTNDFRLRKKWGRARRVQGGLQTGQMGAEDYRATGILLSLENLYLIIIE